MIGKNATSRGQEQASYSKIYSKLFPTLIALATEVEQISRQLFEELCFQIVRWFANSRTHLHPDVESLLDALVEGASSKSNSELRDFCSRCVAQFAKWSLKQLTDKEISQSPANIKSLIRRIASNSNHPDSFKRLSAVLCFSKVFSVIRESDPLVDRFCLEIGHCVVSALKLCHNNTESGQEVVENCRRMMGKLGKVMERKFALLLKPNEKRSVHPNLTSFMLFLFEKFAAVETTCRRECISLWESLVRSVPPHNSEGMPDNLKDWIVDFYIPFRKQKSIFARFQEIDFQTKQDEGRKGKMAERQKSMDSLTA